MKKYQKYISIVFALAIIVFPSVTFAVWWNPLTWFQKVDQKPIVIETEKDIVDQIYSNDKDLEILQLKEQIEELNREILNLKIAINNTAEPSKVLDQSEQNKSNSSVVEQEIERMKALEQEQLEARARINLKREWCRKGSLSLKSGRGGAVQQCLSTGKIGDLVFPGFENN